MAQHGCYPLFLFLCAILCAGERHDCDRRCSENESPKSCYFHFTLGISQRKNEAPTTGRRVFLSINGRSPGPMISVCQHDTVVVDVRNQLPSGVETSLHWHGFSEENSPFADGVPMITQCPIFPRTTFRYRMRAHRPGTFYYHAHSVAQQLDGIFGPLIVHDAKDQTYSSKTVVAAPQMGNLKVFESGFETDLNVTGLRLDVFDDAAAEENKQNEPLRLRIINAAAVNCPLRLFTHLVPLKVLATDGNDVRPSGVSEIFVNPGERIDLLIKPDVMKMTHVAGQNLCKGHAKYGFDPGISEKTILKATDTGLTNSEILEKLESEIPEKLEKSDVNIFLPYDLSIYKNFNGTVDFRYKLGALTPYAPPVLTKDSTSLLEIHNKVFLYPPSPVLSQPDNVPEDIICDLDNQSDRCTSDDNGFCECLQIINLPYNKNVDLFIIDEGKNGNTSQTIHVHGHSFYVLSVKSFDKPIHGSDIENEEALGRIKRNLVNPIRKDTILVPNKGYVILRLKTANPGKWLIESTTSKSKTGSGLEVILNVEDADGQLTPPEGFPTCGSMKEPDLVFGSD